MARPDLSLPLADLPLLSPLPSYPPPLVSVLPDPEDVLQGTQEETQLAQVGQRLRLRLLRRRLLSLSLLSFSFLPAASFLFSPKAVLRAEGGRRGKCHGITNRAT